MKIKEILKSKVFSESAYRLSQYDMDCFLDDVNEFLKTLNSKQIISVNYNICNAPIPENSRMTMVIIYREFYKVYPDIDKVIEKIKEDK